MVSVGIREPGRIKPIDRHPFAERFGGKQTIDQMFVRFGAGIVEKCINLSNGWR